MNQWELLIVGLAAIYMAGLSFERIQAIKDRKKLKHVIYVNGTRGKSTVTRLIAAGLRHQGMRVVCKTTGTVPVVFHADGKEELIRRNGPANIREQLSILHLAAKEKADVLVIECMAIDPELQWVSQNRMLNADIGVITNARIDHTDVMGETREEILDAMMNMLPKHGMVFTAEKDLFSRLKAKAESMGSQAVLALTEEADDTIDFAENVSLAMKACMSLGVSREDALEGMRHYVRDPFAMEVFRLENLTFVNAMSTNDVESAQKVYKRAAGAEKEKLIILINNREDRPARAHEMVRLCENLHPETVILLGDQVQALRRLCMKKLPQTEILLCRSAKEVPLMWEQPVLMLAVGNIKNEGIALYERVSREARENREVVSDV